MGRVDGWSHCTNCYHICHCNTSCSTEVGIGMTDKTLPCECKICQCPRALKEKDERRKKH